MRAHILPTILLGLAIAALAAFNVALDLKVRELAAVAHTHDVDVAADVGPDEQPAGVPSV